MRVRVNRVNRFKLVDDLTNNQVVYYAIDGAGAACAVVERTPPWGGGAP